MLTPTTASNLSTNILPTIIGFYKLVTSMILKPVPSIYDTKTPTNAYVLS